MGLLSFHTGGDQDAEGPGAAAPSNAQCCSWGFGGFGMCPSGLDLALRSKLAMLGRAVGVCGVATCWGAWGPDGVGWLHGLLLTFKAPEAWKCFNEVLWQNLSKINFPLTMNAK